MLGAITQIHERSYLIVGGPLGRRIAVRRDPDDEIILSTADAAGAKYIVTYDKDLLELPQGERRRFKFEIVTPAQFLDRIGA